MEGSGVDAHGVHGDEEACTVFIVTFPSGISLQRSIHKTNERNASPTAPTSSRLVGTAVLVLFDEEPKAQGGKGHLSKAGIRTRPRTWVSSTLRPCRAG